MERNCTSRLFLGSGPETKPETILNIINFSHLFINKLIVINGVYSGQFANSHVIYDPVVIIDKKKLKVKIALS